MNLYNIVQVLAFVPVIYTTCIIIIALGNFLCVPKLYNIYQKMYDYKNFDRSFALTALNLFSIISSTFIIFSYTVLANLKAPSDAATIFSAGVTVVALTIYLIYKVLYSFIPKLKNIHTNLYNKNIKGHK